MESPLGAPRITEQPRRHGSSARYVHDHMAQGYRLRAVVVNGAQVPKTVFSSPGTILVISLRVAVITLRAPPAPHGSPAGSVHETEISGTCAYA